ncbi:MULTISPECIES: hypothetical protein [unclassified Amedibacterium]|uniref:hypothetical protein n=1 Tax=unclassified Amedibacterium TaxID=3088137 RepID=UPI000E3F7085|nr:MULTISPECIES: hypothetical protein [unclassified Absiella]RGB65521.1 hypothetical protein DW113_11945 [Absiella sp. AM09-45]RGB74507.1 hypothetical protein DW114_13630 [Absiella sp. AM09-50]RGC53212.1 hypothetical protein DW761_02325 [Absiella sp. AM29-15]
MNHEDTMNLIQAIFACDSKQVAIYIEKAHLETSILHYNDDVDRCQEGNALAYTIFLAYILWLMAQND